MDQLARQDAEREAERHAEMDEAGVNEPVLHEQPQAEVSLEPSWQPGDARGQYEPEPVAEIGDFEAEL
ncbi:MAG TPA: hypothetical protein VIY52_35275 [Streptosporangiaceae bacterium]